VAHIPIEEKFLSSTSVLYEHNRLSFYPAERERNEKRCVV
jgi:hypothetical protein